MNKHQLKNLLIGFILLSLNLACTEQNFAEGTASASASDSDSDSAQVDGQLINSQETTSNDLSNQVLLLRTKLLEQLNSQQKQDRYLTLVDLQSDLDQMLTSLLINELATDAYSYGPADAPIVIHEFNDYSCGFCKKTFGPLRQLVDRRGDVRLVIHEFPILGVASIIGAQFAVAAAAQDKHWEFHEQAMQLRTRPSYEQMVEISNNIGISEEVLRTELGKTDEIDQQLQKTRQVASAIGISSTPSFVIADKLFVGAPTIDESFERLLDAVAVQAAEQNKSSQ